MKIESMDLKDYFKWPNPGILSYLDALERGQPEVLRTPLFGKAPFQEVCKRWMNKMIASGKLKIMPGLEEIEKQQAEKVGPFSVIPPSSKRLESVKSFWTLPKVAEPVSPSAVNAVKHLFRAGSLNLATKDAVVKQMRLNTNAGPPLFVKRRKALEWYKRNGYTNGGYPLAAIWGTRVQPGGPSIEDEKVRDVMFFPMLLNILESQFYYPLIAFEQEHLLNHFSVFKLRDTEQTVTTLFNSKPYDQPVLNTDFSKFDQHYNKHMQDVGLEVLKYAFNRGAHQHIEEVYPLKYNIPLIISKDQIITGSRGMGSGSGGTNPDENLGHKALQFEAAEDAGQELGEGSSCLGDDGILTFKGISIEKVIATYTKHGLEMNEAKQYMDAHSTYYLQRYYHDSFRDKEEVMLGVYSTERALGRLLGQERFYDPELWSAKNVVLRSLQISENCNNHPCFYEFIDFVKEGDEYALGQKIPGFFENIERDYEEYKANFGVDSYTSQNEDKSILDWKCVRYLMTGQRDA